MPTIEEQVTAIQARIMDYEKNLDDFKGKEHAEMKKEIVRLNEVVKNLQEKLPAAPPVPAPAPAPVKDPLAALIDGD